MQTLRRAIERVIENEHNHHVIHLQKVILLKIASII